MAEPPKVPKRTAENLQALKQWKASLMKELEALKKQESWIVKMRDYSGPHFEGVGKTLKEWVKKNPPPVHSGVKPILPARPLPPPGPGPKATGDITHDIRRLQRDWHGWGGHVKDMRNLHRGEEGTTTLATLLVMGATPPLLKIGAVAVKLIIEEAGYRVGEHVLDKAMKAIDEARTPATRKQFDALYRNYVDWKVCSVANYGITPEVQSAEDYCWNEYGIDISVLK